ncbi:MAG: sigma-54-dependent Fis family transcriptional regulator [Planctomycetes bacterium]|nr:sigma-54-dependent Fis family transcriptional regulator [Planctomycetota bacterium]
MSDGVAHELASAETQSPESATVLSNSLLRCLMDDSPVRAGLVGESAALRTMFEKIRRLARSDVPVLVQGEVGVGKENVARALHLNSQRSAGPFVAEAGAALREELFMRHLFGHARGAFTGATATVPGVFDGADGGTLYIDEVPEVPLAVQACLVRVLETGEYRPLGSPHARRSSFRLITSTSSDLRELVASGTFRRDLFFRLRGAIVEVPPLRERRRDILPLAEQVIREEAQRLAVPPAFLSDGARAALVAYAWPGNVRELRNEIRQAVALCGEEPLTPAAFQFLREPLPRRARERNGSVLKEKVSEVEAAAIRDALRLAAGNKTAAARRLGVTRRTLYRRLERLAVENKTLA